MTGVLLGVLLGSLAVTGLGGRRILRRAAPALVRTPRLAAGLLVSGMLLWLIAVLSLGPMAAWLFSGPSLLPGQIGDVCQRCIAAASPFSTAVVDTAIPVVVLFFLPTGAELVIAVSAVREARRLARTGAAAADVLRARARAVTVHDHRVLLIAESTPVAFALPSRLGGIVLADSVLDVLSDQELIAVLEHEAAHLRQRHHLIMITAAAVGRVLGWVPLIAGATEALPTYLEIAADDSARRRSGVPALAGALLKLGEPSQPACVPESAHGLLHAAGPQRIRHLVRPEAARGGIWAAFSLGSAVLGLVAVTTSIQVPYVLAAAAGCV